MLICLGVILYLVGAACCYGLYFHYWQTKWPLEAAKDRQADQHIAAIAGAVWPATIFYLWLVAGEIYLKMKFR